MVTGVGERNNTKENDILDILKDIRRHRDNVKELVKILEGITSIEGFHHSSDEYQTFCEAYTIYIIRKFASTEHEVEIVIAVYGMLQGYNDIKKLRDRREKYAKEAAGKNELISPDWGNKESALSKVEKRILEEIADTLNALSDDGKKKLGLSTDVLEKNFPNGLPKKLPLVCPKYVNDIAISDSLTDNNYKESLSVDTEQTTDDDSANSGDESTGYEPETYTDDEPTSVLPPDSPEDTEESFEELSDQDSLLSLEESMQFDEDSDNAFWDDPEDEVCSSTTIFPVNKRERRIMILKSCLVLGVLIYIYATILHEEGIRAIYEALLWFPTAMVIFLMALAVLLYLSIKASKLSYARKSNSKTRRSYTVQKIKDGVLGKRIVFNSISDSSYVYCYKGNEKRFVSAAKIAGKNTRWQSGFIEAEDGAEYLIRIFIHNDNPNGYDAVAKHCRVKIRIPGIPSKEVQVRGIISSDNARPGEYWDSVTFYSIYTPFKLVCLEPAMLYNDGIGQNGYSLDQRIKDSEGALIGYDYCDGEIPGGDGYESNILLKVKVVFDDNFIIKFRGQNYGPDGWQWQDTVEADIWDTVSFQIGYKNSSDAKEPQENVTISIDLPESLCYIPRSASLHIIPHPIFYNEPYDYEYDSLFLPDGLDIGDFNPKASATITFRAEVVDRGLSSGYNEILATVKISVGEVTNYDTVKIIINKE